MGVLKCNGKQPVNGGFIHSSPIFAIGPNGFNSICGNIRQKYLRILSNLSVRQRLFNTFEGHSSTLMASLVTL